MYENLSFLCHIFSHIYVDKLHLFLCIIYIKGVREVMPIHLPTSFVKQMKGIWFCLIFVLYTK